ncbi:KAP family P-loop NTPase fold protein [Aeromonas veronii]|uniref:KAP family P-loop NTPase fold protein n=1 Tax=Aeromonas veronii TaxID=654 RepID=UPI00187E48A5|nr:P-loop NTPase fold protein [Aeromonas veronii]MBE8736870.1 NTPase KAP [Aeromonas veronii]MBE8739503.1 NTPase KAP [Aeromonas veronii]MBE8741686.1 NTPase KAP [Aeromonas veronii]MBE8766042.1 NTPase KAP [Aeromonas veronii]MBE8837648.1 NTPase KAP [Aeromonas veronii]
MAERTVFDWQKPITWDGPGAIDGVVEKLAGDRLERARYAEFLTNYLAAEGKQRNYVLNLNAEWGAGKTWFIKRWYMELKAHYPTVYIDAWQQDFSDDPLLTVISSIIDQLKMIAGKENPIPEGMRQRLLGLFKVGGKLALKAAIKKAGLEEDDFSLEGEDANLLVDALCSNQKERYESIQYLKKEIRQWVAGAVALGKGKLDYPAFILIDELDRCRPSYAVEMLETIKHIFDIPRVVFVLATDTEQLQHAVKVIYGSEFDAYTYLSRFFNRRFSMLSCSRHDFVESHLSNASYLDSNIFETIWPRGLNVGSLNDIISAIADACQLSLRSTEKLIDRSLLVLVNMKDDSINIVFLAYLIALHEIKLSDYETIISSERSHSFISAIKLNEIKLHGMNNISGTVSIKMENDCNGAFRQGVYQVPIRDLVRNYLFGYLGEYQNIDSKLKSDVKEFDEKYKSISAEVFSEKLKEGVLNSCLRNKSRVDMSIYRDLVELAISFE